MTIDRPTDRDIPALRELWKEAFGDSDEFLDGFFREGFAFDRCRCLFVKGQPVAALYWFDCDYRAQRLAYLYAVATKNALQGQGLCRALMDSTHAHLEALGYGGTLLVPGNEGLFRLYEKLGYVPFCPRKMVTVSAGGAAVEAAPISPERYLALREGYLPQDAARLQLPALRYVGTYCGFYEGDGFAFCGAVEDEKLYCQEFLGDVEKLPGVLRYFGAASGECPLFVEGEPYAMYRGAKPVHFGLPMN